MPLIRAFLVLALALPATAGLAAAPAGAASSTLTLGLMDSAFTEAPASRDVWLRRAVDSGTNIVRIPSSWVALAPTRPQTPEDPNDPAYRWTALDEPVRAAIAHGLTPIVSLTGAPGWASGPGRPANVDAAAWRPDAGAYGRFATALARRYDGTTQPRVRYWLPWNEPNLAKYLAPQWVREAGRWRTESPALYRALVNAFTRGVKAVRADNRVIAGATAPFGDPQPGTGARIPPARFVRDWLSRRTSFDVLSHHPYSTRGPLAPALNADDVSVPDLAKLTGPLRDAERAGRVHPRGTRPVWVTEMSWDSSPPDPDGVPSARHARWVAEALRELWRQGVAAVVWFQIRDAAPEPSYGATNQSGLYLRDGRAKLAQRAFALPLVAQRPHGSSTKVWLRAPAAGRLAIQRRRGGRWTTVARLNVKPRDVVQRRVRARRGDSLRVRLGARTSATWPL